MKKAIYMNNRDNIAVVVESVQVGDMIYYMNEYMGTCSVQAKDDIMIFHKVAINDIEQGASIYKYGECIGIASIDIQKGKHVHVHNVGVCRKDEENEISRL